ncbi:MAG: signal recognition particle-docking protein FtsY [Campylobacterales bacterium]
MINLFKQGLSKTAQSIKGLIPKSDHVPVSELEEALLASDMAYEEVEALLERLVQPVTRPRLEYGLLELLPAFDKTEITPKPFVELIIGVNGAGKTTTIAKLAKRYKDEGHHVLLGAADTFRAAAIEQLKIWADRLDVAIVSTQQGHDPSGVAYDAVAAGVARKCDRILIDTAGRLHTQKNLGEELKKIVRVCDKACAGAPHRKLLVLDGTQGRSAINQAREFHNMVGIDGLIITKLDGTAKGGSLYSISRQLGIPVLYVGVGEKADDLIEFDAKAFTASFIDPFYGQS